MPDAFDRSRSAFTGRLALSGAVSVVGLALASLVQPPSGACAQAPTTIQLPTVREFSVSTSVLVPDRGSTSLGGVSRSAYSGSRSGVPGLSKLPGAGRAFSNRAIGRSTEAGSASVRAYVHDLEALDRAALAAAESTARDAGRDAAGESSIDSAVERKAAFLSRHVARPTPASGPGGGR